MQLNPSYRYIGLDFETTGLDFTKDEPIQIGIIEIDSTGKIIKEFSSLLKPNKDINQLKTIVGFITGININQLTEAPTPEDIFENIKEFFTENTVIIGHNINFDIKFLDKFFPGLNYQSAIDTFPLAQAMIHYQSSYALEVLVPGANAHNALQDTKNALTLFQKTIERCELLQKKYPILQHFANQKSFGISAYISEQESKAINAQHIKFEGIPKLNKILAAHTQTQSNATTTTGASLENQKRYFVGNILLKNFLERIAPNKNIILTFSNLQKLNIAKSMLNSMGIKNLGFLKDDQIIDYQKFEAFLNKESFNNEEILFIYKYYSHLEQGLGILDLNTKSDYQIYHFLKNKKEKTRYPIVLSTHQGLFSYMQESNNEYKDYEIFFFDAEWRYKSYNFFLSRPRDMYYTLNFIETILYKKSLEEQTGSKDSYENISHFYNSFQIGIGQLFMESKHLFTGNNFDKIQSNPITTDPTFYKTNLLRKQIKEASENLKEEIETSDREILQKQLQHIDILFNTVINIEKKMMNDEMYFVYSEHTQYTSWSEFIEIFPSTVYFFSNSDKSAIHLYPNEQISQQIPTTKIGLYDKIIGYITNPNQTTQDSKKRSFFIVSTRKEESKQIFDTLYKNKIHEEYTIVAENITGGTGKNVFKLKNTSPKIIIGGYAFLLSIYAECIPLDEIIVFNIRGGNEQSILDDIQWYANI